MKPELSEYNYCNICGGKVDILYHEGYRRPVCTSCGHVFYINPVPAVCQVILNDSKVLLVLRAADPQKGMWCLPGGFVEWGENPEDGAKRELFEETGVTAEEHSLIGVYNSITGKNRHVILIAYRVLKWTGESLAGDDAEDVQWFDINEIPTLAFEVHKQALDDVLRGWRKSPFSCTSI